MANFETIVPLIDLSFAHDINIKGPLNLVYGLILCIIELLAKLDLISLLAYKQKIRRARLDSRRSSQELTGPSVNFHQKNILNQYLVSIPGWLASLSTEMWLCLKRLSHTLICVLPINKGRLISLLGAFCHLAYKQKSNERALHFFTLGVIAGN